MSQELVLTNARIVTRNEVFEGSLCLREGLIAELQTGSSGLSSALDCEGDYLLPGLVELHTDNLEKCMTPRPKVHWPAMGAVVAHDAQMTTAGITTVHDAISCGDIVEGTDRYANVIPMIEAVCDAVTKGMLRADHRLHLRCEVASAGIVGILSRFLDHPLLDIVSLMDHSPGQRQFIREDKYRTYFMGKYHFSEEEMEEFTRRQREYSALYGEHNRKAIAAQCRQRNICLATHDDATVEHIAEAEALGIRFAEFPTTLDAATAAHEKGIHVLMGAPNIVRGGSHSGNVAALDLAKAGTLDLLSSDYVPVSLLHGAFLLNRGVASLPLPQAIAMVTATPAEVAGLTDRGSIAAGLRADLVRVTDLGEIPVVRSVWREGRRVA